MPGYCAFKFLIEILALFSRCARGGKAYRLSAVKLPLLFWAAGYKVSVHNILYTVHGKVYILPGVKMQTGRHFNRCHLC